MRQMHKFRSSCACAKYHPDLCSPFIHFVVSSDSVGAQADLGLRCLHMLEDTFLHGVAHTLTRWNLGSEIMGDLRKTGSDISTTLIQGFKFTNSASRVHVFNFTNSRFQLREFNFTNSTVEFVKSNSWIHEVEFVKLNSWGWNRNFVKLKSWIREVETLN